MDIDGTKAKPKSGTKDDGGNNFRMIKSRQIVAYRAAFIQIFIMRGNPP